MDSSRTAVEVTHFILCRNSWKDKFVLKWIILGCLAVHWNKLEKIVRILHIHLHQLSHLCIIHIRVSGRFGYNLRQGRSNGNKVFVNVVHVGFIFRYIKVWFSSRCDRPLDFRSVIPDLYLCWEENPTPETDFFFFLFPLSACWTLLLLLPAAEPLWGCLNSHCSPPPTMNSTFLPCQILQSYEHVQVGADQQAGF